MESEDIQLVIAKAATGNRCILKEVAARCSNRMHHVRWDHYAFARRVGANHQITGLDVPSAARFWSSVRRYRGRGALVSVGTWAVLWVMWLH